MKSLQQVSAIAVLLCAFIYPSSIAEAKNNSDIANLDVESSTVTANNGELLIAGRNQRRRVIRRRYIRRPVIIRRRYIRRPVIIRRRYIRRPNLRRQYIRRQYIQI